MAVRCGECSSDLRFAALEWRDGVARQLKSQSQICRKDVVGQDWRLEGHRWLMIAAAEVDHGLKDWKHRCWGDERSCAVDVLFAEEGVIYVSAVNILDLLLAVARHVE